MTELIIKTATLDDVESICQIQASCYEAAYLEQAISFFSKIDQAAHSCWVARLNGQVDGQVDRQIIAYLIALPVNAHTFPALNAPQFERCASPTFLYLHDLAVHPDHRNYGAGSQLIAQAMQYAKVQQIAGIALIAVQRSTDYWQKQGFEISCAITHGLESKLNSFGADAVFMLNQL